MAPPKKIEMQMSLAPADIDGRHHVVVTITPDIPQEQMQKAQLIAAMRAPGVDGRPFMDDRSALETIWEAEHPDLIKRRIDQQLLPAQSQEVAKLIQAAAEADWKEENPTIVKKAEKILNPDGLPAIKPDQMMALLEIISKYQQGAQGLPDILGQAGMPGAVAMAGGPGGAPGGPMPGAMPSQLQMTPEQALPNPATLPSKQARRGKPQNK